MLRDASNFSPNGLFVGSKVVIVQWTTAETASQLGTFADITTPTGTYAGTDGTWVQLDNIGFQIHYDLVDDQIYLYVPEPSTWAMFALGLGLLFFALRKRLRMAKKSA
jgi:hypothetical protein